MKLAILDPFCGICGNMMLGALLDAGLDRGALEGILHRMPLEGWRFEVSEVTRAGLRGTHVEVVTSLEDGHRHLSDIARILSAADLPGDVGAKSLLAFEALAQAEARVHGCLPEEVHFHEVGAADAILDIVGSFAGLYLLDVDEVHSSPVAIGYGTVKCSHGILPVPAPATALLLEGIPCFRSEVLGELTTPTGAALLRTAVSNWGVELPPFTPEAFGMGAGTAELACPNLLRLTLANRAGNLEISSEVICELVTLIDDMDPRLWPELEKTLLAVGAVDLYLTQCIGRKGRPAIEATILCPIEVAPMVRTAVYTRTPTLGMRVRMVERDILAREMQVLETPHGAIRVKVAFLGGRPLRAEPEFSDCAEAAGRAGLPVANVLEEVRILARTLLEARKG